MKKKNRHISKFLSGQLPEPDIHADDAWTQMHDMLENTGSSQGIVQKLLKFKWLLATVPLIAVSALLVLKSLYNEPAISSQPKILKENPLSDKNKTDRIANAESETPLSQKARKDSDQNLDNASRGDNVAVEDTIAATISQNTKSFPDKITKITSSKDIARNQQTMPNKNKVFVTEYTSGISKRNIASKQKAPGQLIENGTPAKHQEPVSLENTPDTRTKTVSDEKASKFNTDYVIKSINSRPGHFVSSPASLQARIRKPEILRTGPVSKKKDGSIHFGLEWNLNTPLTQTDYLFSGNDSINRPAMLLIPGLVVSKKWRDHQLTFNVSANQSYFGKNQRIAQVVDSTFGDSSLFYYNTNFIKATGFNFSLQYHYQFYGPFSVGLGSSYHLFSGMLAREQGENRNGETLEGPLLRLKGRDEMWPYIKSGSLAFKVGLLFNPGRFQAGANLTIPVSSIIPSPKYPVRNLNGQLFLRFFIW